MREWSVKLRVTLSSGPRENPNGRFDRTARSRTRRFHYPRYLRRIDTAFVVIDAIRVIFITVGRTRMWSIRLIDRTSDLAHLLENPCHAAFLASGLVPKPRANLAKSALDLLFKISPGRRLARLSRLDEFLRINSAEFRHFSLRNCFRSKLSIYDSEGTIARTHVHTSGRRCRPDKSHSRSVSQRKKNNNRKSFHIPRCNYRTPNITRGDVATGNGFHQSRRFLAEIVVKVHAVLLRMMARRWEMMGDDGPGAIARNSLPGEWIEAGRFSSGG